MKYLSLLFSFSAACIALAPPTGPTVSPSASVMNAILVSVSILYLYDFLKAHFEDY